MRFPIHAFLYYLQTSVCANSRLFDWRWSRENENPVVSFQSRRFCGKSADKAGLHIS